MFVDYSYPSLSRVLPWIDVHYQPYFITVALVIEVSSWGREVANILQVTCYIRIKYKKCNDNNTNFNENKRNNDDEDVSNG